MWSLYDECLQNIEPAIQHNNVNNNNKRKNCKKSDYIKGPAIQAKLSYEENPKIPGLIKSQGNAEVT